MKNPASVTGKDVKRSQVLMALQDLTALSFHKAGFAQGFVWQGPDPKPVEIAGRAPSSVVKDAVCRAVSYPVS